MVTQETQLLSLLETFLGQIRGNNFSEQQGDSVVTWCVMLYLEKNKFHKKKLL